MRALSEKEQNYKYSKYHALNLFPPAVSTAEHISQNRIKEEFMIPLQERDRLLNCDLDEQYMGYGNFSDGTGYVSTCTYMPSVQASMIDWWFVWHGQDAARYAIWDKEDHYGIESDKLDQLNDESIPMNKRLIGVTHKVLEDTGCGQEEIVIKFQDPKDFFTPELLERSQAKSVIWANGSTAVMCHVAFPNPNGKGIVLTSHFWMGYTMKDGKCEKIIPDGVSVPEAVTKGLALHSIKEYANLGYMLPFVYAEEMEGKTVVLQPVIESGKQAKTAKQEKKEKKMNIRTYSDKIVETAIRLYMERGTENVQFSDIDRTLGEAAGFTYNFFSNNHELVNKCVNVMENQTISLCTNILENENLSVYSRVDMMLEMAEKRYAVMKEMEIDHERDLSDAKDAAVLNAGEYQKLTDAFVTLINNGNDQGLIDIEDPEVRASFIVYGLLGMRQNCKDEEKKFREFKSCVLKLLEMEAVLTKAS